jgi:hypothetical protein
MSAFPDLALALMQPYAWAVIHAKPPKNIENRSRASMRHLMHYRGRAAIHASMRMPRDYYTEAAEVIRRIVGHCPPPYELQFGGIIGSVDFVSVISESGNPWFFGPMAFTIADPEPCEFIPCKGALGFFQWKRDDSVKVELAKWMKPAILPSGRLALPAAVEAPQLEMFVGGLAPASRWPHMFAEDEL